MRLGDAGVLTMMSNTRSLYGLTYINVHEAIGAVPGKHFMNATSTHTLKFFKVTPLYHQQTKNQNLTRNTHVRNQSQHSYRYHIFQDVKSV